MIFAIAQAQLPGAATDLVPPIWKMAAGFLVVLALLALLAWLAKRTLAARKAGGVMTVETALSLGDRRSLVIVAVENRRLLVGVAPGQVGLVTELRAPSFDQAMATASAAKPEAKS